MKKILKFIKEYWYVLGAIIIALVVFSYWRKTGIFSVPESIELPYGLYETEVDIRVSEFENIQNPSPVFDVSVYNKVSFEQFLQYLNISSESSEVSDGYLYGEEEDYVQYYPSTGLAYMDFQKPIDIGLTIDSTITDENILSVIDQIQELMFSNFPDFRIQSSIFDGSVEVKIDFKVEGYNSHLSSYYLDGSAMEIGLTEYGKLEYMYVLMVSDIEFYQSMPMISDDELSEKVNITSFPKSIDFEVDDENFSNLHPAIQEEGYLSELRTTDVISSWVYFDDESGYAIPMYLCYGDGVVRIEYLDENFSANTIMYVTSIDPNYLTLILERESISSEEEDEVGRGEGDLFIGEPL